MSWFKLITQLPPVDYLPDGTDILEYLESSSSRLDSSDFDPARLLKDPNRRNERPGNHIVGSCEVINMAARLDQARQNGQDGQSGEQQTAAGLPHPGRLILSRPYVDEEHIEHKLVLGFPDRARELTERFEGINFIESLVNAMQIPTKTYEAACLFFHKFRLNHGQDKFLCQDAAIACLFVACKCEDTLKKSREILCAAYHLKVPGDNKTPDDKMFDKPQQLIISLERLVLEAICFDFRVRYPLEKAIKLMKKAMSKEEAMAQGDPKNIYAIVWDMTFDMYKTYMPLKNTEFGMAYSVFELATRLLGKHGHKLAKIKPEDQDVPRMRIRQGLKDLLELYTQYPKHTKVGLLFDLDKFLEIKIEVNKEIEDAGPLGLPKCSSPPSLTDDLHGIPFTGHGSVTNRFVFDVDEARREQAIVKQHFEDQYEEVEVEVEEEIPEPTHAPAPDRPRDRRGHVHGGHGGPNNYRGGGRGGHGHGHGGHHNQDRHGHEGWGGRRNDRNRRGGRGGAPY